MSYQVREGIILKNICDVWLLIAYGDAANHCLYVREINDSLAWYWHRFVENRPLESIISEALEAYDAPEEVIRRDVEELFITLCELGYLLSDNEGAYK